MVREQDGVALRAKRADSLLLPPDLLRGVLYVFDQRKTVASFKTLWEGYFWHDGSPLSMKL